MMTTQDGYKKDAEKYKNQIKEYYKMTIEESREEKIKAEEAIVSILNELRSKTGLTIIGIDIDIFNSNTINGDKEQAITINIGAGV